MASANAPTLPVFNAFGAHLGVKAATASVHPLRLKHQTSGSHPEYATISMQLSLGDLSPTLMPAAARLRTESIMNDDKLDVVFEGGGARGLALNGAVTGLEASGYVLDRVIGTSAGSITAMLSAIGYSGPDLERISLERTSDRRSRMTEFVSTPHLSREDQRNSELGRLLKSTFGQLLPRAISRPLDDLIVGSVLNLPGMPNIFNFVERGGIFSADGFVKWLSEQMEAKEAGLSQLSFSQLYSKTRRHLSMVVTDTTTGTMRVLNHHTTPQCPVVWGVRMSMSIPLFWQEVVWAPGWGSYLNQDISGHVFVDGGLISNFPIHLFLSDDTSVLDVMGEPPPPARAVVGLELDSKDSVPNAPKRISFEAIIGALALHGKIAPRIERLLETILDGSDRFVAEAHRKQICSLPVKGYGITEFNMSTSRIEALLGGGRNAAKSFAIQALRPSFKRELSVV